MEEIWKDINGFEGYYQISNQKRVKSIKRYVKHSKGGSKIVNEKIIKPFFNGRYFQVCLSKEGVIYEPSLHTLLAEAFIPNPNNLPYVNHKDCDTTNNNLDNLEWCTPSYNTNYADANTKRILNQQSKTPIIQYDLKENFIKEWDSQQRASKELGINQPDIWRVLNGKRKTAGGFIWKYK